MKIPHFSHVYQLIPYPGSKSKIAPILRQLIPPNVATIYSPFMGSATFEIYLSNNGMTVFTYDKLPHIVNLFQRVQENKIRIQKQINKMIPCKKEKWEEYVKLLSLHFANLDKWEVAAMTYVVYLYSMSGITRGHYNDKNQFIASGYTDRTDKLRFKSICTRINQIHISDNIQFGIADYRDILNINRSNNAMLYLDPPYDIKYYLYGFATVHNKKEQFDHVELRDLLNKQSNWILSYGDTKQIRELYVDYKILEYSAPYCMSPFGRIKTGKELVILSKDISDYWDDNSILSYGEDK